MKKLLLFFVMAVFTLSLPAQNVVSLVYQPLDLGLGVKYGRHFERSEMYVTAIYNYLVTRNV